jgi:hypothetical protein
MQIFGYIFFICALFAMVLSLQVNVDADFKAMDKLQKANEFAVHDGAIPLKIDDLAAGGFKFDQIIGRENYMESISFLLDAEWNGTEFIPNGNSFFQEPIRLVYLDFVDSSHPSCSSFPCSFNVPIINKAENLAGPSVLAILESESPRFFAGDPSPVRKLSIYEYK